MAVINVLDKKFGSFGKVINQADQLEFLSRYNYEERSLKSESNTFKFNSRIFLERLSGQAIINLSEDRDSCFVPFYFDTPIMINSDISFSFMPLTEDFSYCIYYESGAEMKAFSNFSFEDTKEKQINCRKLIYSNYKRMPEGICTRSEKLPFWELIYFIKGEFELKLDGVAHNIKSPSYVFVSPEVKHSLKTGTEDISYLTVMFTMDCPKKEYLRACKPITSNIGFFFDKIIERVKEESLYNDEYILSLLEIIIAETLSYEFLKSEEDIRFSVTSMLQMNEVAMRAERLIFENIFNSELSVGFIAKQLFISTSYLYRCSMLKFGVGISEYIHNRKLEMACDLIKGNKYSLSEIASILNFCSQSYFSTRFKKKYGISPLQYSFRVNNGSDANLDDENKS